MDKNLKYTCKNCGFTWITLNGEHSITKRNIQEILAMLNIEDTQINETIINPQVEYIKKINGENVLIINPAIKLPQGINPCDGTSMHEDAFPNISFEHNVWKVVFNGILQLPIKRPIKSPPHNNVIKKVFIFKKFLV